MTKPRKRRTGSDDSRYRGGYKASGAWVTRPGTGKPYRHSERHVGRSDVSGKRRHVLPREISGSVPNLGLPPGQPDGRGSEKSAEAIVVADAFRTAAKGRIFDCREQTERSEDGSADNSAASYRVARATVQQEGGTDRLYVWRPLSSTAINRNRALAAHAAEPIEETAVYAKYVRWCGRTGL